jgi:hypothetical protein
MITHPDRHRTTPDMSGPVRQGYSDRVNRTDTDTPLKGCPSVRLAVAPDIFRPYHHGGRMARASALGGRGRHPQWNGRNRCGATKLA